MQWIYFYFDFLYNGIYIQVHTKVFCECSLLQVNLVYAFNQQNGDVFRSKAIWLVLITVCLRVTCLL